MRKTRIGIIGYGSSSLFLTSVLSKEENIELTIFDKNDECGKKLALTSSGRANILNSSDYKDFITCYNLEARDLIKSLFKSVKIETLINYFENNLNVLLEKEDHNRTFPKTKKAVTVIKALESSVKAKIYYNTSISSIVLNSDNSYTLNNKFTFDKVIIATGGTSFKNTGSTGDIIKFSRDLDLKYIPFKASLAPIKVKEQVAVLQGIVLKDVKGFSKTESFTNDIMFTKNGLTGPLALSLRSSLYKNDKIVLELLDSKNLLELEQKLINENKNILSILNYYFPKRFSSYLLKRHLHIKEDEKTFNLTKETRKKIIKIIKSLEFTVNDEGNLDTSYASYGGLCLSEINKLTFELNKYKNLYCIGEALNVCGYSGGYNLSYCFASAYKVASTILKEIHT